MYDIPIKIISVSVYLNRAT